MELAVSRYVTGALEPLVGGVLIVTRNLRQAPSPHRLPPDDSRASRLKLPAPESFFRCSTPVRSFREGQRLGYDASDRVPQLENYLTRVRVLS